MTAGEWTESADGDWRRGGRVRSPGTERTPVVGRRESDGPVADLGVHRAPDGSDGGPLRFDLDRPHAGLVVGKRGYGKSYTLGVLAEELARTRGIAPVVLDPMGVFDTLAAPADGPAVPCSVIDSPRVPATAIDPPAWCRLLGLSPEHGAGALVWQAAARVDDLAGMCEYVAGSDAPDGVVRAARNHLSLAETWEVFDPAGIDPSDLAGGEISVVDLSALDPRPTRAVVRAVVGGLYRARVSQQIDRLPWILVDEAHAVFDGVAADALETVLTRGRQPGVSLVLATQRPGAVHDSVPSQSDLLVAHRLTSRPDVEALERARPSFATDPLTDRMPTRPGEATLVDDATESVYTVQIRKRDTPHGGASPRTTAVSLE